MDGVNSPAKFGVTFGAPCLPAPMPRRGPLRRLREMLALYRQRRQLAALDPARLRDLGLTRAQADEEAMRPVWDVPRNWRS